MADGRNAVVYRLEVVRPVWLWNRLGMPLVAGPDPVRDLADCVRMWVSRDTMSPWDTMSPGQRGPRFREHVRRFFSEPQLTFRSRLRARVDIETCSVQVDKDRRGEGPPPFRSEAELELLCTASGWPEPEWLDDVLDRVVAEVMKGAPAAPAESSRWRTSSRWS